MTQEMGEKVSSWEPVSQLDRELLYWLKVAFRSVSRQRAQERAWVLTHHAQERYALRLQRIFFAEDTNDVGLGLLADLQHPRLKRATGPEMARIRASCVGHSGRYSREPYRYFMLRDMKRQIDEIFVAVQVSWRDAAYRFEAKETWRVVTCFFERHEDGTARRTRTQDSLFKGLRTGAVARGRGDS